MFDQLRGLGLGRSPARSLWIVVVAFALGLASLVLLDQMNRRVLAGIGADSKKLLAADFQIRAWRAWPQELIEALKDDFAHDHVVEQVDLVTSLSHSDRAETISLRGLRGSGYPFYGDLKTEPQIDWASLAREAPGILIDPALLNRGIAVGSKVRIGRMSFVVRAVIKDEPQGLAASFAPGPRVIAHLNQIEQSGLLSKGSRAFRSLLVKSDERSSDFEERIRRAAPDPHWRIVTPEKASKQTERILERLKVFFGFVALASLLMAAVALYFVFRSRLERTLQDALTLRCLGASRGTILKLAMFESMPVMILGGSCGLLLGLQVDARLSEFLQKMFSVQLPDVSHVPALALALLLSVQVLVLAVLVPLNRVLRRPVWPQMTGTTGAGLSMTVQDGFFWILSLAIIVGFFIPNLKLSAAVLGALAVLLLVFALGFAALSYAIMPMASRLRNVSWQMGILSLVRRRSRSLIMGLSLGVTVFTLSTVLLLGASLKGSLNPKNRSDIPNLFAIAVPNEVRDQVLTQMPNSKAIAVAQVRIESLSGKKISEDNLPTEEGEERFARTQEFTMAQRSANTLLEGESLTQGQTLFGESLGGVLRVSLEERFAKILELEKGSDFEIELAGVALPARVTSLRRVSWLNLRPNFNMVVADADVQGAPMDSLIFGHIEAHRLAEVQSALSRQFQEVSFIDSQTLADRLLSLLSKLSLVMTLLSLVSLVGAGFVIVGIQMSRRIELAHDFALLRVLGLTSTDVRQFVLVESFFTGLLATMVSAVFSWVLSWWILKTFLDIQLQASLVSLLILSAPLLASLFAGVSWLVVRDLRRATAQELSQSWGQ